MEMKEKIKLDILSEKLMKSFTITLTSFMKDFYNPENFDSSIENLHIKI